MRSNTIKNIARFSLRVLRLFVHMNDGNANAILRHKDSRWISQIWQR